MKNNIIKGLIVATIIAITSVTIQNTYAYNLDKSYKEALVRDSGNANYTVKNMAPILGEKELTKIIKKYDNHPEYFIADVNEKGDQIGVKELTYRGGFHSHTTASDGKMEPIDALEQARDYAQKVKSKHPFRKYPVILAYTDHYNTNGCKEVIDIIQKNPEKYKNVKIILGMETTAATHLSSDPKEGTRIHILLWAINPYAPEYENINYYENFDIAMKDARVHEDWPDYRLVIKYTQSLKYGMVGIAHPLRYYVRDRKYDDAKLKEVMNELFKEYSQLKGDSILFTEGYYQPYKFDVSQDIYNYTADLAKQYGIYRTGSHDSHGNSIFSNQ